MNQFNQTLRAAYALNPDLTLQAFTQLLVANWNYRDLRSAQDDGELFAGVAPTVERGVPRTPRGCRESRGERLAVTADQDIPAALDGLDPFARVAHGHARHREEVGLLLQAARVGGHHAGVLDQGQRLAVADRRDQPDVGRDQLGQAKAVDARHRARMRREDHGLVAGAEGQQDGFERGRLVGVRRAVSGGQHIAAGPHPESCEHGLLAGGRQNRYGEVEHDVADLRHAGDDAFGRQVGHGGVGRAEQQAREMVRQHTIDLFGHAPVEGAQARFDVRDGHVQLGRGERPGEGRVRVAVDQDEPRTHTCDGVGYARQHGRRLACVAVGADPELDVGARQGELFVEHAGELMVVVLAGVEQDLLDYRAHRARDDRRLDVLRTVADYGQYDWSFHARKSS